MSDSSDVKTTPPGVSQVHQTDEKYLQRLLSELALAKTRLDEGSAQTTALLNSLGEGLIVTDEHGRITTANTYATMALGYEQEELIGRWFPKTIVAVDKYSRPISQLSRPIVRALTSGRPVSDYTYYLTKTGDIIPVHITVSPVLVDGTPTGAVEVFQDLTKERQLDIAKEEFVSLASHQLRTPATGMKSILSMLSSGDFGPLTEVQHKYLGKAIQANDRQLQIIEDLLNVALVDAGKMELDLDYADLSSILQEVLSDHAVIIASRQQAVKLQAQADVRLLLDIQKSRMIIDNLISNASKYSPAGAKISVNLVSNPNFVELSVCDQGVGIAEAEIPRLFTKFTRLSNELSASVGGTGLGLFLTKSMVELHNGTISVTSEKDSGTTFTVRLPTRWSHSHA